MLALEGIHKSFGRVHANRNVSLTVAPGEKHALLGENGAGKSTLVKIVSGGLRPDAGTLRFDGRERRFANPSEARIAGIGIVAQHFTSFDGLTVAENLAVALPDRSLQALKRDIREIGEAYGLPLDAGRRVGTLSAGEKQRVEIVRCLLQDPRLIILDEPTSVLTPQESATLFATLDRLAGEGRAILYITHRLQEVRAHCDRATIMRHGEVVATCDPREETPASLAEKMIGAAPVRPEKRPAYVGGARLQVSGLTVPSTTGVSLRDISFTARKGEILGIAGVAGEGQAELFSALSGERPSRPHDAIRIDGAPVACFGPTLRRERGAAFAPEDRHGHAALPDMRLSENLRLSQPRQQGFDLFSTLAALRERFDIRADGEDPFARTLSGGNLQKFTIGREIMREPGLLIAAQPTWGVDAGAASAIHSALLELREKGAAIVVISQDLDEIFTLCDRVAVLSRGTLSEPTPISTATPEQLGLLMAGVIPEAEPEAGGETKTAEPAHA